MTEKPQHDPEQNSRTGVQTRLNGGVSTQLVNVNHFEGSSVELIGRSTRFGNPFKMKKDGGDYTRSGCVEAFAEWFYADEQSDLRQEVIEQLSGETLGCYCLGEGGKYASDEAIKTVKDDPSVCHGEVILRFLNQEVNDGQSFD